MYRFEPQPIEDIKDDGSNIYGQNYWLENSWMMRTYRTAYGCENYEDIVYLHYHERAAHWMRFFLRHILPPARVLEIGCGIGSFTHWLTQLGFQASATELSPGWQKILHQNLGIEVTGHMLCTDANKKDTYDAIALFDVFEHIPEPVSFFEGVANELKQDGIIMIQVPCYEEGKSQTQLPEVFLRHLHPDHAFIYSKTSIQKLLAQFDFKHIAFYPTDNDGCMLFVASRSPLRQFSPREQKDTFAKPQTFAAYAALLNYELMLECREKQISVKEFLKRKTPTPIKHFIKKNILRR